MNETMLLKFQHSCLFQRLRDLLHPLSLTDGVILLRSGLAKIQQSRHFSLLPALEFRSSEGLKHYSQLCAYLEGALEMDDVIS